MGRPLNRNIFGSPLDTNDKNPVLVFDAAIIENTSVSFPYIVVQNGPNKYIVSDGNLSGEVTLRGYDPIIEGDASMKVITPSGNIVYAIKIYENTVECSDGNTYYWNKYNYVSNTDTVTVNSMVASQYKSATNKTETGRKISTISTSLNTMVFDNDPAAKNITGVGGAGYGATFDISSTNKKLFSPSSITLLEGGLNYKYGEVISVPNVGNLKVTEIMSNLYYITSVTATPTTAPSLSDYSGIFPGKGGSGVNASFVVSSRESAQYQTSNVTIVNGGTGYKLGDVIDIDNVGRLTLTNVDASTNAITEASIPLPTHTFTEDPTCSNVSVTGGTGTNATFSVQSQKVYVPNTVTIIDGGTKYTIGDKLTIANTGTVTVSAIDDGTHTITGVKFVASGTYYSSTDISGDISVASTSGTTATLKITSSLTKLYYPTSLTLLNGGAGYTVGDIVTVGNSGKATVTALAKSGSISSSTFTSTSQYYTSDVAVTAQVAGGGSGAGATFDVATSRTTLYTGNTATIVSGGTGYTVGQILTIPDFGTVKVETISTGGTIATISVSSKTTTSVDASKETSIAPQTTTSGSGATFSVTTNSAQYYVISSIKTNNAGSAYKNGDSLTIGSIATVTVTGVSKAGTILTATTSPTTITIPTNEAGTITATGGTGSGATFTVATTSTTSGYVVSDVSIVNGGTGFNVGQTITENFGVITISTITPGSGAVSAITFSPVTTLSTNDIANNSIAASGGTGTGATFKVTSIPEYRVSSIELNSGGRGYSVDDTLTLSAYQLEAFKVPSLGSLKVTGVQTSDYHVMSLTLSNNVISPTNMENANLLVTGGSGSGLVVNVASQMVPAFNVASIGLNAEGTGYKVGDVLTVGNAGTVTVRSVGSIIGKITGISLMQPVATYYQDMAASNMNIVGGSGNGLKISVTSKNTSQYYISSISINSQGTGYDIGDILRVGNAGRVSVVSTTS